jgi:hypothetical protein
MLLLSYGLIITAAVIFACVAIIIGHVVPDFIRRTLAGYSPPRLEPAWGEVEGDEDEDTEPTRPVVHRALAGHVVTAEPDQE